VDDLDIHTFGEDNVEIEAKMVATSMDNRLLNQVIEEMSKLDYVSQAFWTPSTSE
jgi:putative Mg2+ transporter-C (MgtC) family protein